MLYFAYRVLAKHVTCATVQILRDTTLTVVDQDRVIKCAAAEAIQEENNHSSNTVAPAKVCVAVLW